MNYWRYCKICDKQKLSGYNEKTLKERAEKLKKARSKNI